MDDNNRSEEDVFSDLSALCSQPGFVHVISYLCYRDNTVRYAEKIVPDDILHLHSMERLIRTETSVLIGLLVKQHFDFTIPEPDVFQSMILETESLLAEIHKSMSNVFLSHLTSEKIK